MNGTEVAMHPAVLGINARVCMYSLVRLEMNLGVMEFVKRVMQFTEK